MMLVQKHDNFNFKYEVVTLLTTATEDYDRISMHGMRTALVDRQAKSLALSIHKILISKNSINDD